VRDANQVIFLEAGRIAEAGTYDELSQRGGRFAALLKTSGLLNDDEPEEKPALPKPPKLAKLPKSPKPPKALLTPS
jgi:ATP-binding cassette subfamily B protein